MFTSFDINTLFGPIAGGGIAAIFARFYLNKVINDLDLVVKSMVLVQKDIAVFSEKFRQQDKLEQKIYSNAAKITELESRVFLIHRDSTPLKAN